METDKLFITGYQTLNWTLLLIPVNLLRHPDVPGMTVLWPATARSEIHARDPIYAIFRFRSIHPTSSASAGKCSFHPERDCARQIFSSIHDLSPGSTSTVSLRHLSSGLTIIPFKMHFPFKMMKIVSTNISIYEDDNKIRVWKLPERRCKNPHAVKGWINLSTFLTNVGYLYNVVSNKLHPLRRPG